MFLLNKGEELSELLLQKMLNKFETTIKPKLQKYENYYDGIQAILNKNYSDSSKPCNKKVTNFCKNITDSYCGYLASAGCITYTSEHDITEIMNVLRYNDYQDEDSDFLLDALIYGVGAELMYIDEDAHTRFKLINPTTCFAVYDNSLSNDMLYFVRWYKASEWNETDNYIIDVYSDTEIKTYNSVGIMGGLTYKSSRPHHFSQVPANVFMLPDEVSIFDCIIGNQDSYNTVSNASLDDYEAFVDAFLALTGLDADEDDITSMKENRVLILPEGATANWLTKGDNMAAVDMRLKRIESDIYRIASCPDFSSESFTGGVTSGVAIRYKLCGMENRAAKIASIMKKALQRRIELISGVASLMLGEEIFRDITITFVRNIPNDIQNITKSVNELRGFVSNETLLGMLPQIDDVQAELDKIEKQQKKEAEVYNFSNEE